MRVNRYLLSDGSKVESINRVRTQPTKTFDSWRALIVISEVFENIGCLWYSRKTIRERGDLARVELALGAEHSFW